MGYAPRPLEKRFWEKVRMGPSCWEWLGATAGRGYGVVLGSNRRQIYAHRASWALAHGEIPPGLSVCHKCDNPICVRPDHLFLGDSAANHADMVAKGRSTYGDRHGGARLSSREAAEIRERRAVGESCRALALIFGVCPQQIHRIGRGERWGRA